MTTQQLVHPSPQQLRAFLDGRLAPREMAELESHVAACDSCCRQLEQVPDDTLVQLARAAATAGFRAADSTLPSAALPPGIPAELENHPRYRVLGLIGFGGMGAVYKAEHRLMERLVALKVISPALLDNAAAIDRFRREFRAAARLSHPNVVTAFDADQAGNLHFLVMEFVEGLSLDRLVTQTGPLSVTQACHFVRQAAIGLQHVHEQGMVHRDIKPQNLMVMRKGQVKILDCGLARIVTAVAAEPRGAGGSGGPEATTAGMILGTPDYIAPEQVSDPRAADIRADIYSLGCTLYYLLAGRPPFPQGSITDKLAAHAAATPPPLAQFRKDVPDGLSRVLNRMLAKDPAARYAAPGDLARDLAPFAGERPAETAQPATSGEPPPPPLPPAAPTQAAHDAPTVNPLGSFSLTARLPASKRGPGGGVRFSPQAIALATLAVGVALALIILAFPLADWLFQPAMQPLPRKALVVLPPDGLWLPDFNKVKYALEQKGIQVVSASTSKEPVELFQFQPTKYQPPQPIADVVLDDNVRAQDYGAIVFTGYTIDPYLPHASHGNEVRRLLDEAKQSGRLLTAVCRGQMVLLLHGELRGKRVAHSNYAANQYLQNGAIDCPTPLERAGQCITAATDGDAFALADAIDQAFRAAPSRD